MTSALFTTILAVTKAPGKTGIFSDCRVIAYNQFKPDSDDETFNFTGCNYVRSFQLPINFRISVCMCNETVQIDLRQFLGETSTTNGIHLSFRQWDYLQHISNHVYLAIKEARH